MIIKTLLNYFFLNQIKNIYKIIIFKENIFLIILIGPLRGTLLPNEIEKICYIIAQAFIIINSY